MAHERTIAQQVSVMHAEQLGADCSEQLAKPNGISMQKYWSVA